MTGRSPVPHFSWECLTRTGSQATIHSTPGVLYLRRLRRGDERDGKVDPDLAQG